MVPDDDQEVFVMKLFHDDTRCLEPVNGTQSERGLSTVNQHYHMIRDICGEASVSS